MKAKVRMNIPGGLHLRPAQELCSRAMCFKSTISMEVRGAEYNVKSVLSVLCACVRSGEEVEFSCSGDDEAFALRDMVEAADSGLSEYMRLLRSGKEERSGDAGEDEE